MFEKTKNKISSSVTNKLKTSGFIESTKSLNILGKNFSIKIDEVKNILASKGPASRRSNKKVKLSNISSDKSLYNTNPFPLSEEKMAFNFLDIEKTETIPQPRVKFNKKKIDMINNELKTLEIPNFNSEMTPKNAFFQENETKEKTDNSTLSKYSKDNNSSELFSNFSDMTPTQKHTHINSINYTNSPNNPFTNYAKNISIIKSKFTDKIQNYSSQHHQEEFVFQDNSFDSLDIKEYNNNKDSNPLSNSNSNNQGNVNPFINSHSNNEISLTVIENEIESDFEEIIEIFEDFNSNEPRNDYKSEPRYENNILIVDDKKVRYLFIQDFNEFEEIFNFTNQTANINDYSYLRNVSKGGYGIVDLYRKINTRDIYVIKSVDIDFMV